MEMVSFNKKLFKGFRVMGKIVNQRFDEQALTDVNLLIAIDWNFKILIFE